MATKQGQTYISVPPPPLPEFYRKQQRRDPRSASSSSAAEAETKTFKFKETVISVDGQYDGKPGFVPLTPLTTVPQPCGRNDVPPLAIYHICRICLRPRSPRYHREHPIPLNGVPPPPGICRRCRVTSLEETKKVTGVVFKSDSQPIKMGCITPFVPDKDIVSNEEMQRMKIEKYLRSDPDDQIASRRRGNSREDVVFRHVKVVDASSAEENSEEEVVERVIEEVVIPRKKKVIFTSRDAVDSFSEVPIPEHLRASKTITTRMQVQPTDKSPSVSSTSAKCEHSRKIDSTKTSVSARASFTSRSGSPSTVRASAKASVQLRPGHTESDMHRVARGEIEEYAKKMQQPEERHKEIRKLAREEVERYRQAERKLEAHPDAYAHGKLVPVERRIDVERDIAKAVPWKQAVGNEDSETKVGSRHTSGTAQRDFAHKLTSVDTKGRTRSVANSQGVEWHREVSVERHSQRESNPRRVEPQQGTIAKDQSSAQQTSTKSREISDRYPESKEPRSSTKQDRYFIEVSKPYPGKTHNVTGAVEEMGHPSRSRTASYGRHEYDYLAPAAPKPSGTESAREPRSDSKISDGQQSTMSVRAMKPVLEEKRSESTKQPIREYWSGDASIRTANTQSVRQSAIGTSADQHSSARIPVLERSTHASTHSRVTFQDDHASDKTRWSRRHRMAEEGRAGGAASVKALPYPEVNAMPDASDAGASQRKSSIPSPKKGQELEYLYIERTVQPANRPPGSRPFDGHPRVERIVEEETYVVRRRPEGEPRRRRRDRDGRPERDSDGSNHVKFNKKVDISPTPPGSDASSSEFRSFHSIGPRNGKQIDGDEDPVQPGDIIGEHERRGRKRSRNSRTNHFYEREIIHETADGIVTVKPGEKRKGGGTDRQAAWVPGSRPLERPLSESPSREEAIQSSRFSKSDGKGPYREDGRVTDSMHAEDGSPGGRVWRDGVGGSMHSCIGQAAQVFW